jgi:hypothetical protein
MRFLKRMIFLRRKSNMKVSEAIELLSKEDPDSLILVENSLYTRDEYKAAKELNHVLVEENKSHRWDYDYSGKYKKSVRYKRTSIMDEKRDGEIMGVRFL